MELELMYPKIIVYSFIISFVLLLFWRRKRKYKKGILVANTNYIKKSKYYKLLLIKYRIYNLLIKVCCIILITLCAVLSARIFHTDKFTEERNNRDIILCMDVSGSVASLNSSVADSLKSIVSSLKDERFGITIFDNSAVSLVPLTNDYNYAVNVLNQVKSVFETSSMPSYYSYNSEYKSLYNARQIMTNGTRQGEGASLIGDGLTSCALSFKNNQERTKILILTTDNEVNGSQIVSVPEASTYCKENNIKIYAIGTKNISTYNKQELVAAANNTGGIYFDFSDLSTDEIAKRINSLDKSAIVSKTYVMSKDFPEVIFPYLLIATCILFVLDWRVRI